jgi:hypothetical protein
MPKHIVMAHSNSARIDDGVFKVDRKFHVGMRAYEFAKRIEALNAAIA